MQQPRWLAPASIGTPMSEIERRGSWDAIREAHSWVLPPDYNLAWDMVGRWARAEPDRLALIHLDAGDRAHELSYGEVDRRAARLANVLSAAGLGQGDRVAVLLPQCPEVLLTHLAAYRLGAIVVPLFTLFGVDGLDYRLRHSGARMLVTDGANLP